MSASALKSFESSINDIILESLKACLEPPGEDESGEPDWSPYDDFVNYLSINILNHTKMLVSTVEKAAPKVSKQSSTSAKSSRRSNTYTQWVRVASNIRKGITECNQKVTIGSHFSNPSAASACKYNSMKDDLELEGRDMSVSDLLAHLKDSLPGEKDLTLTAIAWGLMPKEFRDNLVAELDV